MFASRDFVELLHNFECLCKIYMLGFFCSLVDRLASGNRLPHLLLYGPPGTGKTSTVLAMARKLYGNKLQNMVLELNASDDRGIDVVRQQIQDFASTQSISFGYFMRHTSVISSVFLFVQEWSLCFLQGEVCCKIGSTG